MARWPPRIAGQGGGGVVPPSGDDHFCPNVIVGNIPAGDPVTAQAAPFQYIGDTGDGAGIIAALAALPAGGGSVCVRRGTYTIVGAPITVPVNSKLYGAGVNTNLASGSVSRQVVRQLSGSVVDGFQISVSGPPNGSTGTEMVLMDSDCKLRNCTLIGGAGQGDPIFAETLTAIVRVFSGQVTNSGCSFEELILNSIPPNRIGIDMAGDFHAARRIQIRRVFLQNGAGPGIRISGNRNEATAITGQMNAGFEVTGDSNVIEGTIETRGGGEAVSLISALRSRVSVIATAVAAGGGVIGISIDGSSDRNMIIGSSLQDFVDGVDIAVGAEKNILLGTQIDVTGTPVVDLGTLTETAHIRT